MLLLLFLKYLKTFNFIVIFFGFPLSGEAKQSQPHRWRILVHIENAAVNFWMEGNKKKKKSQIHGLQGPLDISS